MNAARRAADEPRKTAQPGVPSAAPPPQLKQRMLQPTEALRDHEEPVPAVHAETPSSQMLQDGAEPLSQRCAEEDPGRNHRFLGYASAEFRMGTKSRILSPSRTSRSKGVSICGMLRSPRIPLGCACARLHRTTPMRLAPHLPISCTTRGRSRVYAGRRVEQRQRVHFAEV